MNQGISTVIYPVKDIRRAKKMFNGFLGVEPYADSAYYVGYKVGDQDIGLDPNAFNQGMKVPIGYYNVSDIKQSLQGLVEAGVQVLQEIKDVGGGKLIATVNDTDGNMIGLIQTPQE
ncbi:MAG: glyoxalase [Chloroflexi bacterium RBG_13_50_21]|nr:MAG: glyoxalase [Chloroflexi bacterium RBG_13_50_21]